MSDIVLSAGVRSNLLNLQQTSDLITSTQTKLATGKRVNSALDNPTNFFTSQGLSNRAADLGALLDAMSTGINTIQAANNGITAITKLVQSAQSLASQALQTSDVAVRAGLATQFDAIRTQIDQLAGDAGFNGINLLNGNNLTVVLNESGTSSVTNRVSTSLPAREWKDINELEIEEAAFDKRFDHVLLGHYHVHQRASKRTWYAGSTDSFWFSDRPRAPVVIREVTIAVVQADAPVAAR